MRRLRKRDAKKASRAAGPPDPASAAGGLGPELTVLLGVFLVVSAPVLASCLLIGPRRHYLQVPATLALLLAAKLLSWGASGSDRPKERAAPSLALPALLGAAFLLFTPNIGNGWSAIARSARRSPPTRTKNTIEFVRGLATGEPVTVMWTQGVHHVAYLYFGPHTRYVSPRAKQAPFGEFARRRRVDIVIWPWKLLELEQFRDDPDFRRFLEEPESYGFRAQAVPGTPGPRYVFTREEYLRRAALTGSRG